MYLFGRSTIELKEWTHFSLIVLSISFGSIYYRIESQRLMIIPSELDEKSRSTIELKD